MKVVVVTPTYNERENILPLLSALQEAVAVTAGQSAELEAIERSCPGGEKSEPLLSARGFVTYQWYEVLDAQDCIGRLEGTVLPSPEGPSSP